MTNAMYSKAYARRRTERAAGMRPAFVSREAAISVLRLATLDLERAESMGLTGRVNDAKRRIAKAEAFLES